MLSKALQWTLKWTFLIQRQSKHYSNHSSQHLNKHRSKRKIDHQSKHYGKYPSQHFNKHQSKDEGKDFIEHLRKLEWLSRKMMGAFGRRSSDRWWLTSAFSSFADHNSLWHNYSLHWIFHVENANGELRASVVGRRFACTRLACGLTSMSNITLPISCPEFGRSKGKWIMLDAPESPSMFHHDFVNYLLLCRRCRMFVFKICTAIVVYLNVYSEIRYFFFF